MRLDSIKSHFDTVEGKNNNCREKYKATPPEEVEPYWNDVLAWQNDLHFPAQDDPLFGLAVSKLGYRASTEFTFSVAV